MSIIENINRPGNFSSSEIFKLTTTGKGENGFGAPAITYIKEKNFERKLGRCVKTEVYTRPMAWGSFIERYVFDEKLGFEYELHSKTTDTHPYIPYWVGSKDLIVPGEKIGEIKCYEPKNFAEYTDVLLKGDLELFKTQFPQEYWQCISNAIINEVESAEAISFIPYRSELALIREIAANYDGDDAWKYSFICERDDVELPFIPDNGYYKNLNRLEFKIPQSDIDFLTAKVIKAGKMLFPPQTGMIAKYDLELKGHNN